MQYYERTSMKAESSTNAKAILSKVPAVARMARSLFIIFIKPTLTATMTPISQFIVTMAIGILHRSIALSAIPCPGIDIPSNEFVTLPLYERPNLERVLRNGFFPQYNLATKPTTQAPGNPIQVSEGFVDRPFRQLNESFCPEWATFKMPLVCSSTSRASFGPAAFGTFNAMLAEQVKFEASVRSSSFWTEDFYNPSYEDWAATVEDFLTEDCGEEVMSGMTYRRLKTFSCSVIPECQQYSPDFIQDIAALPIDGTLDPYRTFVEKWGYGAVEHFGFGAHDLRLISQSPGNNPARILYMGRGGGMNKNFSGDLYTEEDCSDPAPIDLKYRYWYQILLEDDFFSEEANITDLEGIRRQFLQLTISYDSVYSQATDRNFTDLPECPSTTSTPTKNSATAEPSDSSSSAMPSVQATITPSQPSSWSSDAPSYVRSSNPTTNAPTEEATLALADSSALGKNSPAFALLSSFVSIGLWMGVM